MLCLWYDYLTGYCPNYPAIVRRPGFDHGYSNEGKMPFDQGEQRCKDKGVTMPVMESYKYAEDIQEFLGQRKNGNWGEIKFWLGKEKLYIYAFLPKKPYKSCTNLSLP